MCVSFPWFAIGLCGGEVGFLQCIVTIIFNDGERKELEYPITQ